MISVGWFVRPAARVRWWLARRIAPLPIVGVRGDALLILKQDDAWLVIEPSSVKVRSRLSLTGQGARGTFVGTFERP